MICCYDQNCSQSAEPCPPSSERSATGTDGPQCHHRLLIYCRGRSSCSTCPQVSFLPFSSRVRQAHCEDGLRYVQHSPREPCPHNTSLPAAAKVFNFPLDSSCPAPCQRRPRSSGSPSTPREGQGLLWWALDGGLVHADLPWQPVSLQFSSG